MPPIWISSRWYFKRAPQSYRAESSTYAGVSASVAETVDAGQTVELYRLEEQRIRVTDDRWSDFDPAFSPDGRRLAAAPGEPDRERRPGQRDRPHRTAEPADHDVAEQDDAEHARHRLRRSPDDRSR